VDQLGVLRHEGLLCCGGEPGRKRVKLQREIFVVTSSVVALPAKPSTFSKGKLEWELVVKQALAASTGAHKVRGSSRSTT